MKPTALVTGAGGFLGGHLISALRRAGYPVVGWTRTPTAEAADPGVKFERWPPLAAFTQAIEKLDRPIVYHLAAAADRIPSEPIEQFDANIQLTANLVHACANARACAFVYAGSGVEYGPFPAGSQIPESAPLAALDLYGASKAAAGLWAQAVARNAGLGFAWARLFPLYGPGLRPPRLMPMVHAALRANSPMDLTPGSPIRDWVYVGDAADGMVRLGEFAETGGHGIFNLCTGHGRTTREVATMFARRLRADIELLRFGALPARPNEPPWLVGDPGAARKLGWSAHTDFAAGLDATIAALDGLNEKRPPEAATSRHGP